MWLNFHSIGIFGFALLLWIGSPELSFAQSLVQDNKVHSAVTGEGNNVIQIPNQNSAQNHNSNEVNVKQPLSAIYTPVPERDLGLNLSLGLSSLDNYDMTVQLGLIFQPGRTRSHDLRMEKLQQEIDWLKLQKQKAQLELELLQSQLGAIQ